MHVQLCKDMMLLELPQVQVTLVDALVRQLQQSLQHKVDTHHNKVESYDMWCKLRKSYARPDPDPELLQILTA